MTLFVDHKIEYMSFEEEADFLKTMAHPMRLKLVNELYKHKALNVTQITQILKLPQSTVSQHLSKMRGKVLKGNRQGLEIYYSINNPKVEAIIELLSPIR
ncbi:metalloregulator ArsR/SmtB family transcription factor (plasmid) [Bacillus cereus]|uniref:Transcriptional repressor PagR n=1 Tax=Bacillus cereus (strain 03BB102) TaxID=572264 RepID=A0A125YA52_BACC3|nr:metalloregulator ArsR/SmtB family transcription factor [Bacillus cereus]ACO25792.1 transcriptional repressor PagR [Bacillus cereus 03BB102]AJG51225.1 transcriptional repressor pagR [Bacillus cereus 03BB102]QPR80809.1 helix-turn-helix transcriptional regulator [Bacillus cereus]